MQIKSLLTGMLVLGLGIINLAIVGTILMLIAPFKLISHPKAKSLCRGFAEWITQIWVLNNLRLFDIFLDVKWHIDCPDSIHKHGQYLIISNHQTWVDIFVILETFKNNAPYLRFFMKEELKWLPFVGTGCMVLDYPFMKRYSRDFLEKNPHLAGKDLETTRLSCQKFKGTPVAILNFAEGTRFTDAKHEHQKSPYQHLLKPKAGGIAYSLAAFGGEIKQILDLTIVYPAGSRPTLKDFLCNQVPEVTVKVQIIDVPLNAHSKDYQTDKEFKHNFQHWMAKLWHEKDVFIEQTIQKMRLKKCH